MNEAGEPYMTAAQLRFEAELDEQSAHERMMDDFYDSDEYYDDGFYEEDEVDENDDVDEPFIMEDQWLDSYMEDRIGTMYE